VRKLKQKIYAYDARIALWPSRDPIGENGGLNLYGMVGNDPVKSWDYQGLWKKVIRNTEAATARAATELERLAYGPYERTTIFKRFASRITNQYAFDLVFNSWSLNFRAVSRKTNDGFASNSYSVKCVGDEGKESEAYAEPLLGKIIRFRKSFFTTSETERNRIFYHEMTHIYAGTTDDLPNQFVKEPLFTHWIDDLVNRCPEKLDSAVRYIIAITQHRGPSV